MNDLVPVEESRAGFFVTGNEYIRDSLDLKFIPRVNLCENETIGEGVILAADNQTLQQSFDVAKDFFAHAEPGTIKFVLIGLSPYSFSANDKEPPIACPIDEKVLADYFKLCVDNGAKPVCVVFPVHWAIKKDFNADVLRFFWDKVNKVIRSSKATVIDLLSVGIASEFFKNKVRLNSEGAAAISVLLSARLYFEDIISPEEIFNAGKDFFSVFLKRFSCAESCRNFWSSDRSLLHHIFCKMVCKDFNRLSETMSKESRMDLMTCVFAELSYSHLASIAEMLSKDDYIELINRLFSMTAENIRRKDKIKVGFYCGLSANWSGDDLYNLFAQDERFEPTIFVPVDHSNEFFRNDFLNDLKKFKARGLNTFEMKDASLDIPKQDLLFRTHPYPNGVRPAFRLTNLKVKETLLMYIPYTFHVGKQPHQHNFPLHNVLWKNFFPSSILMEIEKKINMFGMPCGVYSGYPKLDVFFKPDYKFHFDWKMARPDAKKIIWAPHWSIDNNGIRVATFRWNYRFMYEFAKEHSEISWVVKPHPQLFDWAKRTGIFSSIEDVKAYFKQWDELPNAQVYTGAYYQSIFATSDGMIQDCISFLAEYQYVDKPMIYLTRNYGIFLEFTKEILKASYTVDGKDLDAIAAMIQRVFIDGDDYKAAERKAVFEKYLDYYKANGMLASEFIYKNITDELKAPTT